MIRRVCPTPILLIRTSNELRISNFLLWQISYSEFYVTETLWPDFDKADMDKAIIAYAGRNRRFGDVTRKEVMSLYAQIPPVLGTLMTIVFAGLMVLDGWLDGSLWASRRVFRAQFSVYL